MRRIGLLIPVVIIYLSAALVLLDIFTTDSPVKGAASLLGLWVSIITGFAILLGLANVLSVHFSRIRRREAGAPYSVVLLVSAFGVIIAGIAGRLLNLQDGVTDWIFRYIYQPLAATLFSLLAFLMVSAAIRLLRIGTVESALLMIGALIVLVGQIALAPLGGLTDISRWFQDYPVLGVMRGILIGTALGAIATSLRYLLGVDNKYL